MSQKDIGNKIPIYKLKAGKEVEDYYDEWTVENKYDKDMVDWKYSGPQETVALFTKHIRSKDIKILDAGCGTGLVGIELKKNGFQNFDGADFSQKMLQEYDERVFDRVKNYLKMSRFVAPFLSSDIALNILLKSMNFIAKKYDRNDELRDLMYDNDAIKKLIKPKFYYKLFFGIKNSELLS